MENDLTVVRNLRDLAYWAFMLLLFAFRFTFTWIYCIVSYGGFHALVDQLRHLPTHFTRGDFAALAFLTLVGFISGAAWWTTLSNGSTQRIWVNLFSLGSSLAWGFGGGFSLSYALGTAIIMVPTVGGLLIFLLPHRLRLSVRISSYRVGSPDQKSECNGMTTRSLRSRAYWAIMVFLSAGRLAMIWCCYVVFRVFAEMVLDEIRHPSVNLAPGEPWVMGGLVIIGLIAAATGWTTLRSSPSHQIWIAIASLVSLVVVVFLYFDPATRNSGYPWKLLGITLGGALVYLLPYRLQWSIRIISFRLKHPSQPSRELHFSV